MRYIDLDLEAERNREAAKNMSFEQRHNTIINGGESAVLQYRVEIVARMSEAQYNELGHEIEGLDNKAFLDVIYKGVENEIPNAIYIYVIFSCL